MLNTFYLIEDTRPSFLIQFNTVCYSLTYSLFGYIQYYTVQITKEKL